VWEIKFLLQQLSELCSFYPKVPNLSLQMKGYGYVSVSLRTEAQDGHIVFSVLVTGIIGSTCKDWTTCCEDWRTCEKYKYFSVYKANKQFRLRITFAMKICTLCDDWETLHLYVTWNACLRAEVGLQWYSAWFLCPKPRVQSQQHQVGQ
jgi:hypothetical protein